MHSNIGRTFEKLSVACQILALTIAVSACHGGSDESPQPTVAISAKPENVILTQSSNLIWSASNSDSCAASGSWSGSKATNGSQTITPSAKGTSTYSLTCNGKGGSVTGSISITAVAEPLTITTPSGFNLQAASLASDPSLHFDNFNGKYIGGFPPVGGAEIDMLFVKAPPPALDNYIDMELGWIDAKQQSRSRTAVSGVPCIQFIYTTDDSEQLAKTNAVYCQEGSLLFKFMLNYYVGDPNETQYIAAFTGMLSDVKFIQ